MVLADDLTGALEAGALLAGAGVVTDVTIDAAGASFADAIVCDLETRHMDARAAADLVRNAARAFRGRYLYKKTDSTLRGPIGAELAAMLEARPDQSLVYVPAYPLMGRTVRGGRLFVDGVPLEETAFAGDPLFPVRTSWIHEIAGNLGTRLRIRDGETEMDVRRAVEEALAQPIPPLLAGPASVARYLAELLPLPRRRAPVRMWSKRALVLNGSLHPASRAQITAERPRGWTVVEALTPEIVRREQPDTLVIFGGYTAHAVLESMGVKRLTPLGELLPGVAICRIDEWGLTLVTKAGGYGGPGLLLEIGAALGAD